MVGPRILFLNHSAVLGGGELTLLDVAEAQAARGEVLLFQGGPLLERLRSRGVRVQILPSSPEWLGTRRDSGWLSDLRALPETLSMAMRVAWMARQHDVLYANSQKALVVGALAGLLARRPVVWHLHDILTPQHFSSNHVRVVITLANLLVRRVICNSQATAAAFVAAGGRSERATVVYCGIDPAPFQGTHPAPEWSPADGLTVGLFGRLAPWKGQHVMIEAMPRLPGMHLMIVGDALFGESEYADRLKARVRDLGLESRVRFMGFRDDIPPLMAACDVVVHTSVEDEPFGRVLVEAMASGKPVVAPRQGGPVEIVNPEADGLLVAPNDVDDLVAALDRLRDPGLRRRLGEAGRQRAQEQFSRSHMLAGIEHAVIGSITALIGTGRAPRVLFVNQTARWGGGELSLRDIASHFSGRCAVALFEDGPLRAWLEERGIPVYVMEVPRRFSQVSRMGSLRSDLLALPGLWATVQRVRRLAEPYDIIYANSQKALIVSSLAGQVSRKPVLWHLRDILSDSHFSGNHVSVGVSLANTCTSRVLANSRATAEAFMQAGGRPEKLYVVYPGIDPAAFQRVTETDAAAVRRQLHVDDGTLLIGLFGRLAPWKGQRVAIEALYTLPHVHLALVGTPLFGETDYEAELRDMIRQHDLADRVHLMGFRDDVPTVMKACDVILHTSIDPEPFGRTVVEGMMAGRPVIATRPGGPSEILTDGTEGYLVAPGSVPALQAALCALIGDAERRRQMGEAAYKKALERFSNARLLAAIEDHVAEAARH